MLPVVGHDAVCLKPCQVNCLVIVEEMALFFPVELLLCMAWEWEKRATRSEIVSDDKQSSHLITTLNASVGGVESNR